MKSMGRTDLPPTQQEAMRSAVRWEWFTIGYTCVTIVVIAFVVGNSQAMRTAWIEDMLSLIPQVTFLIALLFIRRRPTQRFPFGLHRVMGVGHLVAGVALLAVGGNLAYEAISGLVRAEHASIGTVQLFGYTVWLGWLMIAAMSVIVVGPFIYGRAKSRLAVVLHNKLLYADADMAKADWHTNAASIIGVLGIGVGWWWLDGVAALFISLGIVWDGWRNARAAVRDLIDQRARTQDDAEPHPLIDRIARRVDELAWVDESAVRMRDMGQVFHVEVFAVPVREKVRVRELEEARAAVSALDWKVQDIVVVPTHTLPAEAQRAGQAR
jgi:cation diffusion facilitator family transporter